MYRNNLVRTTLSVFVACTLLYTASASAQSSTQLNSPALTPEFSDAPVVTSLGPLLSENITSDESYTPEVIVLAQATATEEAPTMILAQAEPELPQLDTPTTFSVEVAPIGNNLIIISWNYISSFLSIVEKYKVNLYLGTDTNGEVLHAEEHTRVSSQGSAVVALMFAYTPATQYTIELIVQATGHEDSNPLTETVMTRKFSLDSPTRNELVITPSTDNITVTFENTQSGVTGYTLSIQKRFGDRGIARISQDFPIGESPVTFTDLLPDRAYTLMALPIFNSERYEYSGGIVSLDFAPRHLLQPQLETPAGFLVIPQLDGVTATGVPAEDIDRYIFKLYLGVGTSSTALDTGSIPSNFGFISVSFLRLEPGTQYTVEIIARADNYRDSNPRVLTVRTNKADINPPTRNELVITPSTDNITVTFEDTQPGVNGYALSIRERFDDMGIARSTEDSSIGESPVTFTNLVPNRAYTLMALPTFESERYEYSGGTVSLDFMTRDTSLRLRLRVFLEGPLQ